MDSRVDRTNRRQTQTPAHQAPPCTLVIFGAGGDLTKRLLMPAIYNLAKAKLLSEKFAIIAVDRTPKPVEAFRDYLAEGIRSFVSDTASGPTSDPFDKEAWDFVASRITHFAGDLTQSDTYARLYDVVEISATQPAPGVTLCRTTSSSFSVSPRWSRRTRVMATRSVPRSTRCSRR